MAAHLFEIDAHPDRIAVSNIDSFVVDGAFFLDFSRQLGITRWLGFGVVTGLFVPVIRQGEKNGGHVIGIHRSEKPVFSAIRKFWKAYYPTPNPPPTGTADGMKVIADFATQFPNDCR
jgi:hypothetical protein